MADVTEPVVQFHGLPEHVEVPPDLCLIRFTKEHMPELMEAINSSLDSLRPWMPWAQQPVTIEGQTEWLRSADRNWEDGVDFTYGVFSPTDGVIGACGFHVRNGPGVLEIGYWLRADQQGRGVMTRVAAALTDVAANVDGVTRVEIHCDQANRRSAAIPRRLGYALIDSREVEPDAPASTGLHQIWALDLDDAARSEVRARISTS